MERDWVYDVFAQCKEANVPFFFKQWGETEPDKDRKLLDEEVYHRYPKQINHLRQSRSVGILWEQIILILSPLYNFPYWIFYQQWNELDIEKLNIIFVKE